MSKKIIIGISIGDPNGIGLEIIIKSLQKNNFYEELFPVIYCPKKIFLKSLSILNKKIDFEIIKNPKKAIRGKVNLIAFEEGDFNLSPGKITKKAGNIALKSLIKASDDLFNGNIDAIVTAPINKDNIQLSVNSANSGEGNEKIKAQFSSENLNISFNSKYLIDIASEVEDKNLKMNFKDSVSPVLIEDNSDKNSYYVIMPMKI